MVESKKKHIEKLWKSKTSLKDKLKTKPKICCWQPRDAKNTTMEPVHLPNKINKIFRFFNKNQNINYWRTKENKMGHEIWKFSWKMKNKKIHAKSR